MEEVRQAEGEERLFSLMGLASRYSFYANMGVMQRCQRANPHLSIASRRSVTDGGDSSHFQGAKLRAHRPSPFLKKTAQAAWKWPEETVDSWISH